MSNIEDNGKWKLLVQDLTCAICHKLMKIPKVLPQCVHEYCLDCLEAMASSAGSTLICPQCGASSAIEKDGVDAFQTNIVTNSLISYVRSRMEETAQPADFTFQRLSCPHFVVPGEEAVCRHCDEVFCGTCRAEHLETLKASLFEMSKPILDDTSGLSLQAKMAQFRCMVSGRSVDLATKVAAVTESTKTTVLDLLENRKRRTISLISLKADQTKKQIADFFEQLADTSEIETMKKRRLALVSASEGDNLDEIAEFCRALAGKQKMLQLVTVFEESGPTPLLWSDPLVRLIETLTKFEHFANESLTLPGDNSSTVFDKKEMPPPPPTPLPTPLLPTPIATTPLPTVRRPPSRINKMAKKRTISIKTLSTPIQPDSIVAPKIAAAVPEKQAPGSQLEECHGHFALPMAARAIIPYGRDNCWLILINENNFLLIDQEGHLKRLIDVKVPPCAQSMEIFDINTDLLKHVVVFTATLKRNSGRTERVIYRMILPSIKEDEKPLTVVPSFFAANDDPSAFLGIAVTGFTHRVITTCRTDLLAYDCSDMSEDLKWHRGQLVHRCYIGPIPRVYGAYSVDADVLHVTCSVGLSNQLLTIKYRKGAAPVSKSWKHFENSGPLGHLKNVFPGKLSLAGKVAFVLDGNNIYRYQDFPADPFLRCVYTFESPPELEGQCTAISAQRINSGNRQAVSYLLALMFPKGVKMFRTVN